MPIPVDRRHISTRVLLTCGALAALHMLLHVATVPLLTGLAPLSPPLYGLVAGVHSVMPFLARRLTGVQGSASITAGVAAVFIAGTSPSGIIVVMPLLLAGVMIDLVVWREAGNAGTTRRESRYLLAAVLSGATLFTVSLSVFSPEHLTLPLILGTLAGRIVGEIGAAIASGVLSGALARAGVGRQFDAGIRGRGSAAE